MAGASLFALLDDIAVLMDDIALMTKKAATKTAGVIGDDLALNAKQVSGIKAERELPVVWAVAKGSAINKAILIPSALAIGAFAPVLITPLLMLGGAFLCYEGVEKIVHQHKHKNEKHDLTMAAIEKPVVESIEDLTKIEKEKIKGAVRTDFILSAEIIVLTLGAVATSSFTTQVGTMTAIGAGMTVGVYGLVGVLVKLDDMGLHLASKTSAAAKVVGNALLKGAPAFMKFLSFAGTVAMFTVGGEILTHGIPVVHHGIETAVAAVKSIPAAGPVLGFLTGPVLNAVAGIAAGAVAIPVVSYVVQPVAKSLGNFFQAVKSGLGFSSAKKADGAQPAPVAAPVTPAVQTEPVTPAITTTPDAGPSPSTALNMAANQPAPVDPTVKPQAPANHPVKSEEAAPKPSAP